jgi:HEAT repeat protein
MEIRLSIPLLIKGLMDKSSMVRNASAQALYKIRCTSGPHELTPYLKGIKSEAAASALRQIIDDKVRKSIKKKNVVKSD